MTSTAQNEKTMARDLYIANDWVQEVKMTIKRLYENWGLYIPVGKCGIIGPNLPLIQLEEAKLDWARKYRTKIKERIIAAYGEDTLALITKHVQQEWNRRREVNRKKALPAMLQKTRAVDRWVIAAQKDADNHLRTPQNGVQRSQVGAYCSGAGQRSRPERPKPRVLTMLEQTQDELRRARKEQRDLEAYMNLVYGNEVLKEFRTTGKMPEVVKVKDAAEDEPGGAKEGKEVPKEDPSHLW